MRSRSLFNDRAAVENDYFDGLTVRCIDDVRVDDARMRPPPAGGKEWLHRAQTQAKKAATATRDMPAFGSANEALALRAESPYNGELGVAVLTAELANPEFAAMPFFERG